MKDKPWFVVLYMFVVTAVFCSVLIGFARGTAARVRANEQLAFEEAVLRSLPIELAENISNAELHNLYVERVEEPTEQTGGAYRYIENGQLAAYALPIEGQGFWATIRGVIGIEPDKKTVTGIYFYEQAETPGLGAEITKAEFRDQFPGKVLADSDAPLAIERLKTDYGPSEIQAVTGATQTSTRLGKFMNEQLAQWQEAMSDNTEGGS